MCANKLFYSLLLLFLLGMLSACGGGEGNNTPPPPTVAPKVLTWSPTEQETALVTAVVTARFDREMDKDTINYPQKNFTVVEYQTSNEISGSAEYFPTYEKVHNYVAAFTSSKDLEPGKKYTATVTTEVKDLSGNSLARDHVWDFTVAPAIIPVSTDATELVGTNYDGAYNSAIDASGEYIAFASKENLSGHDTSGHTQIYRKNTISGKVELVSLNDNGELANADCSSPSISDTGRYIAFASQANNLDLNFTDKTKNHIYLKDMKPGISDTIRLLDVNKDHSTQPANGTSNRPNISGVPDDGNQGSGRYVVFESTADDLHSNDTDTLSDIYLIDLGSNNVELISVGYDPVTDKDVKGTDHSHAPKVSNNGYRVVFHSYAENLVSNDTNGKSDIFIRNLGNNTTSRLSIDSNGHEVSGGQHGSTHADISADGTYVVFQSDQPTLDGDANNNIIDIFLRKTDDPASIMILSLAEGDTDGANNHSTHPSISEDGRYVTFESKATDLLAINDTNGDKADIFIRERNSTTISLLSVDTDDIQGSQDNFNAAISTNGRYVSFTTLNKFGDQDDNAFNDIYRAHNVELR